MRVRKILALTLAMVLVLGTFTFGFGATSNWIKVFLDEPATSVIAEYDNGDTEVLAEQGGHWNAPDYKDYVTNQIAAFIVDGYRYAPVEPYAGQEANGTVKYDLPTRQEAPMGTITVTKNVTNLVDDTTSFEFSISGGPESVPNDYVDASESTVIDVYYGEYTLEEIVPNGYTGVFTEDTVTVDEDTTNATVQFRNTKDPVLTGTLTIVKEVEIDGEKDTDNDEIFTFTVNGETVTASAIMNGQIELPVGTYTVTETGYGDYTPDSVTKQAIVTTEGGLVTFVNSYTTPQDETGILTIAKEVWIDGDKITDDDMAFNYYIEGESVTASGIFSATTPGQVELPVGTYIVTESGYGEYIPDSVTEQAIVTTEGATVTFVNRYTSQDPGTYSITVNKDVIGTATDTAFEVAVYQWMDQIIPMDEFYGPVRIDLPLLDEGNGEPPPYATTGTIIEGDPFVVSGLVPGDYWVSENPEIEGFYTPPDQLVGIDNENVEVTITNYQYPEIEIVKTVDDTSVRVNEDVTYTITVTNLGGFYLPEVVVEDEQLDFVTTTSLDIGESESFEIETSYSSTGDKVNTATASAVVAVIEGEGELYSMHPDELPITHQLPVLDIFELEVSDSATVNVSRTSTRSTYRMTIEKEADGDFYEVGDTITYTIVVENTGNSRLTDIEVTDDMTGLSETIGSLNPGETEEFETTYVAQESDIGDLTNTATAEDDRAGTEEDDVTVTVEGVPEGVPEYTMTIEKTAMTEGEIFSGDMVEFEIVVTNTGNETLTNILVEDDMVDFEAVIDELEPGESEDFTVKVEAPNVPGPFTNTATATSEETGTQQADDTVFVEEPIPLDVPDTGVAPTDLFFGLGALVSGLGVFFTKKRK